MVSLLVSVTQHPLPFVAGEEAVGGWFFGHSTVFLSCGAEGISNLCWTTLL